MGEKMRSTIVWVTSLSLFALSVGCHSFDPISVSDHKGLQESENLYITQHNKDEVVYEKAEQDSLSVTDTNLKIKRVTGDSIDIPFTTVREIEQRSFSWTKTIALAVTTPVVLFGIAAYIAFSTMRVGG